MKKFLTLIVLTFLIKSIAFTQPQQSGMNNFKEMQERQKQKMKDELKLTEAQADSVVTIEFEFRGKMRGMRNLDNTEREEKMKEINDAKKTRLITALNDEKLVEKIIQYQQKQRQEMMNRFKENKTNEQ